MARRILFICKASVKEGLGHMIRSLTLADALVVNIPGIEIHFILYTDLRINHLLKDYNTEVKILHLNTDLVLSKKYNLCILDMLSISDTNFKSAQKYSTKIVSLSPIFTHLEKCNALITRTIYLGEKKLPNNIEIYGGMEYSIIRKDCLRQDTVRFESNLKKRVLNIAISMGGTDPKNNTLSVLKELQKLKSPAVYWVLLGEGYGHRYEELVIEVNTHYNSEIILARTNKSMWSILDNCSLAILSGGLTSYEAAYAGLPAINYMPNKSKSYLVQELSERELCVEVINNLADLPICIKKCIKDSNSLLRIHKKCIAIFDVNPIENIIRVIDSSFITTG